MAQFDSKSFNEKAFKYSVGRVPNMKMNEIKKSKALAANPEIKSVFADQNGTAYAKIAMRGLIDGEACLLYTSLLHIIHQFSFNINLVIVT